MATGLDIANAAATKLGEAYIEGTLVPKDDAEWGGPWDCAELCSWAVYQVAAIIYGCTDDHAAPAVADAYSGAWKTDAEALGIIIPVDQAASTPGAMVLRAPTAALGGHIVVSDGSGGTIEAKGRAWGVVRDTLHARRWDYGIQVPGIDYAPLAAVAVAPAAATIYRYTHPMMVSATIGELQRALTDAGFDTGGTDNTFGPDTCNAVIAFQDANDLVADGEVGPKTAAALGVAI